MTSTHLELTGTLKADGTFVLDQKPALPPGRVQLVLRPLPDNTISPEDWWQLMQRLRRELEEAGRPFMNDEELNAHIEWLREGDHIDELLRVADAKRQRRERPGC
ncbi:MAG: hypothetical protein L0215_08735 [Gemmataceae bacterium]|nr:hypothetical protein [Gemmataceae bacterium]